MSMNTVRLVFVGLFSLSIFVIIAGTPGPGFCTEEASNDPATRVSEPASGHLYSAGFFERLFGFKRRSGSPETDGNRGSGAKSTQSPAAKDYPPLQPNESLTSGIQRGTPARRAAALRLAEKGRQYMLQKQHQKAVHYLEKALGLEATPYLYYYLSRAHYHLGHYAESANFLDVAAALLAPRPEWATAVAAVRAQYAERASNDDKEPPVARVRAVRPTGMPERSGM